MVCPGRYRSAARHGDVTVTGHPPHQECDAMTSRQPDAMPPGTTGQTAITLLILAGLAGLGGEISGLRWDGPLHGHAVPLGIALEVVLAILLVITIWRLVTRAQAGAVS